MTIKVKEGATSTTPPHLTLVKATLLLGQPGVQGEAPSSAAGTWILSNRQQPAMP
jgi:hypothetical protein